MNIFNPTMSQCRKSERDERNFGCCYRRLNNEASIKDVDQL